jgi:putative transcription factor
MGSFLSYLGKKTDESNTNSDPNLQSQVNNTVTTSAPLAIKNNLSKAIQSARTAKKMTQKELAAKINELPHVINDYESGKAIPNPQILWTLDKALGIKLPRN